MRSRKCRLKRLPWAWRRTVADLDSCDAAAAILGLNFEPGGRAAMQQRTTSGRRTVEQDVARDGWRLETILVAEAHIDAMPTVGWAEIETGLPGRRHPWSRFEERALANLGFCARWRREGEGDRRAIAYRRRIQGIVWLRADPGDRDAL